jgi:hypothetical protein
VLSAVATVVATVMALVVVAVLRAVVAVVVSCAVLLTARLASLGHVPSVPLGGRRTRMLAAGRRLDACLHLTA